MKQIIFAILVAAPSMLVGWVVGRGQTASPSDAVAVECGAGGSGKPSGKTAPKVTESSEEHDDAILRGVFSKPIANAKVKGRVELYDDKGLFDYINGAAPLYIERHFRKLAAAELVLDSGGELTSDVYDMSESKNAESILAKERSPDAEELPSWPGAIVGSRSFVFQYERYYIKLTAFDAEAEAMLPTIAREIRSRLK